MNNGPASSWLNLPTEQAFHTENICYFTSLRLEKCYIMMEIGIIPASEVSSRIPKCHKFPFQSGGIIIYKLLGN